MELEKKNFAASIVDNVGIKINEILEAIFIKKSRDKIRQLLINIKFLELAPFAWITFIYRYGDLPVTVEIASDWIEHCLI